MSESLSLASSGRKCRNLLVLLLQLVGDAVYGVKLQDGGDEQEYYPLVVDIGEVGRAFRHV